MENLDEKFLQKVFEAADKLKSEGKKTTVRAVEAEIGGGNRNKVTEAMKRWREQNAKKQQKEDEEKQLPAEVQHPIYLYAQKIKADAVREVTDEKEMIQDDLDNLSEEVSKLQATLESSQADVETLKDALKTAQAELAAQKASYDELKQEYNNYRENQQDAAAQLAEARALKDVAQGLLNEIIDMMRDAVRKNNDNGDNGGQPQDNKPGPGPGSGDGGGAKKKRRGRTPKSEAQAQAQAQQDPPSMLLPVAGLEAQDDEETEATATA